MGLSGTQMMLKSMGIDVDDVQKKFQTALDQISQAIQHFDARITVLETQNKEMLALLKGESDSLEKEVITNG